jgi:hypothetical protein
MYSLNNRKGVALIVAMIFLVIFATLAVSFSSMCSANLQQAHNQQKTNSALAAAESGLECGRYIVANTLSLLPSTGLNFVTEAEADAVWVTLCQQVQSQPWVNDGAEQTTDEIITSTAAYSANGGTFQIRFYREDTHTIKLEGIGTDGDITRHVSVQMDIAKDSEVMNYAIASRGRMWLTGDSTIYGDIYSAWDRTDISPFNMTSDSRVEGTINTTLALNDIQEQGDFQLETLDEDNNPMFDDEGYRVYGDEDEIQGYHDGINYGQGSESMPGMDISHYDTDLYYDMVMTGDGNGSIASSSTIRTEYFPHASGNYTIPKSSSSRTLNRHVYENQTFTNQRLPGNRNALFKNCTFEDVLYIDCYKSGSTQYNNVRFEDCSFNGPIVTDVPQQFKWKNNCLYFTGEAAFNNTSDIQEATILAPHFNVNVGNTNPVQSDNNVLTGAVVGGIVDVRGNAQVYGTIISMCDTTVWSSGYVTNIGATLGDGGSETTELGDVGTISIQPEAERMLPSGITTPIIIKPLQDTYSEEI